MFSLSTSWNSSCYKDGYGLISEIKSAGFDTVELNFALTESIVDDILQFSQKSIIKVSSLHNMCPLPREVAPQEASPDYYSLSSMDEGERGLAVRAAKTTIDYANLFGAKAIVLHAGRVQVKDRTRDLSALTNDKIRFDALKADMIRERSMNAKNYLENTIKSLAELVPYGKTKNVCLGIENRYYYREIPIEEEFEIIFKEFKPGTLYYWHDVGHAEVFERLGLCRHRELLDKFSGRLIGVHLHDIIGTIDDHNVPGFGTFDFSTLKPYLTYDTLKVIEVHWPATAEMIRTGVDYLNKVLG